MLVDILPLATFMISTSASPGPNNISSMAFCMERGYKNTVPYLVGIAVGTTCIMLLCACLSFGLSAIVPELAFYLRYIGAIYILFLAFKTSKINFDVEPQKGKEAKFIHGMLLQLVNPKAMFFGMTMYSTFFVKLLDHKTYLLFSAIGIGCFTFCMISIWGSSGVVIKRNLKNQTAKRIVIGVMVAALVYVALNMLLE